MFNNVAAGASLSDIAALMRNNDGDGFGGNNGWWILIILWALWGNNGNGFGNGNGGSVGAEVQRGFDTQAIISKLDGLNSGLCSLGYDQLAQMSNIRETVQQTGFNVLQAINQLGRDDAQSFNQILATMCQNKSDMMEKICENKFLSEKNTSAILQALTQVGQNVMQNDNANYQRLFDKITQSEMDALKAENARKDTLINMMNLGISQDAQTGKIIDGVLARLRECPIGTYNVCDSNGCNTSPIQQILNLLNNGGSCGTCSR